MALGGFLVGELKFAMPEARIILKDLGPWLKRAGYLRLKVIPNGGDGPENAPSRPHDLVFIRPRNAGGSDYLYWVQPMDSTPETIAGGMGNNLNRVEYFTYPGIRVLNLGGFGEQFYQCLSK